MKSQTPRRPGSPGAIFGIEVFGEMTMVTPLNTSTEIEQLRKAVEGLTYPSESDEPFDVFHWGATGTASAKDQVLAHAGSNRAIVEVPINTFFDQLEGSDDIARFRQLQRLLQAMLSELKVFRVGAGQVRVDVYLIGKTRAGDRAGLHTGSIET